MDKEQKTIIISETREWDWDWDCPNCEAFNCSGHNGWEGPYEDGELSTSATCYKCKKEFEIEEVEY